MSTITILVFEISTLFENDESTSERSRLPNYKLLRTWQSWIKAKNFHCTQIHKRVDSHVEHTSSVVREGENEQAESFMIITTRNIKIKWL